MTIAGCERRPSSQVGRLLRHLRRLHGQVEFGYHRQRSIEQLASSRSFERRLSDVARQLGESERNRRAFLQQVSN